jgi:hypothetical protein
MGPLVRRERNLAVAAKVDAAQYDRPAGAIPKLRSIDAQAAQGHPRY